MQFGAWSLLLLLLVTAGTAAVVKAVAERAVLRDAERVAAGVGRGTVAPLVDQRFRDGDPSAVASLDRVLRHRVEDGTVHRVKLWDASGVVLWSDDARLVGRRFDLSPEARAALSSERVVAQVSELDTPENALEVRADRLVEVYVGLRDADGQPLLFELYLSTDRLQQHSGDLVFSLLPITVGALVVFQLGVLPLSLSLARQVDRARASHERLLEDAVAAGELERRRIAQDLHDGVIQDLSGLAYLLFATPARRRDGGRGAIDGVVTTAGQVVQRDVDALRSLLTDLYPPHLTGDGLTEAVNVLAGQTRDAGVDTTVDVRLDAPTSKAASALTYRVVREALRNVVRHAGAARARVEVRGDASGVTVRVSDDGRGMSSPPLTDSGPVTGTGGHLGLQLLHDTVDDVGGTLTVDSAPGCGTTVTATFGRLAGLPSFHRGRAPRPRRLSGPPEDEVPSPPGWGVA